MHTTQTLNAGVAIGLAQNTNLPVPACVTRTIQTSTTRRNTLAWGALAVASCAAALLWFKAAVIINEALASLNAAYQAFCT